MPSLGEASRLCISEGVLKLIGWKNRWLGGVIVLSLILTLCGASVDAAKGRAKYKTLNRLSKGLKSVRDSAEKTRDRLAALKKREASLVSKLEAPRSEKAGSALRKSLKTVRSQIEKIDNEKPVVLHKKLTSLFDHGHSKALTMVVGATYLNPVLLTPKEARQELKDFDSKKDVIRAIEKVDRAEGDETPTSKVVLCANQELKKIRFERKALDKKLKKCDIDESSILAEMDMVRALKDSLDDSVEFIRPIVGRVTSPFGERMHPIEHTEKKHDGIDFAGATGDPVKCSANGRVIFAGVQRGYGNIIIVQHSDTLASAYAHLSEIGVEVGEAVAQGQKIGKVGSTGNSTGPHLHFEIRENGEQVNPTKYL